ncbi:hypothetical protein Hanom_Chr16g01515661 [Helianthus anomalus]
MSKNEGKESYKDEIFMHFWSDQALKVETLLRIHGSWFELLGFCAMNEGVKKLREVSMWKSDEFNVYGDGLQLKSVFFFFFFGAKIETFA